MKLKPLKKTMISQRSENQMRNVLLDVFISRISLFIKENRMI